MLTFDFEDITDHGAFTKHYEFQYLPQSVGITFSLKSFVLEVRDPNKCKQKNNARNRTEIE